MRMSSQDDSETADDLIQDACNYVCAKTYPADAEKESLEGKHLD